MNLLACWEMNYNNLTLVCNARLLDLVLGLAQVKVNRNLSGFLKFKLFFLKFSCNFTIRESVYCDLEWNNDYGCFPCAKIFMSSVNSKKEQFLPKNN